MSVDDHTLTEDNLGPAPLEFTTTKRERRGLRGWRGRRQQRPPRPRVRKLRLLLVLVVFFGLAGVSCLFGMLTALASDLPELENSQQFRTSVDSYLYDDHGEPIGVLAPPNSTVLVTWPELNANRNMVNAIVAVEDKRYWTDRGIDVRALLRALVSDVTGGPREGASTIPEEFVKNVLNEEDNRTILEKLREAGIAFQLVHKWTATHILTEYLNTIYFGNGATGVEAAARTYFGAEYGYKPSDPAGESPDACGDPDAKDPGRKKCVEMLTPAQAALLAGMVANPTEFDPILHPGPAEQRRNQVLELMYQQGYINEQQYQTAVHSPLGVDIQQPQEPAAAPYFTAWVRPLVIRALEKEGLSPRQAQYQAYYGGLKIRLTLDLKLQAAAQQAVDQIFPPGSNGPTASLVAIDNSDGEVRAMVSGDGNYAQSPFNLATLGYRQPGSSFKMFTLAAALSSGKWGPDSIIDSKPLSIPFKTPQGYIAHFHVHNFGNVYSGPESLATATAISDNSVFAQVGMSVGTKRIKHYAKLMGIRSPISTTPAMILGGLHTGVSALDMAHAYETAATGGLKIYNRILGDVERGPIGIHQIADCSLCDSHTITNNHPNKERVLSPEVADTIHQLLEGPLQSYGTAPLANIPGVDIVGKTGTTSNYVDAWFVGWTPQLTVAVWVGYPNSGKPMLTNYNGGPVEGGTFPAIIFHNFMVNALQILADEAAGRQSSSSTIPGEEIPSGATGADVTTPADTGTAPVGTTPASGNTAGTTPQTGGGQTTTPAGSHGGGQTTTPAGGSGTGTSGGSGL